MQLGILCYNRCMIQVRHAVCGARLFDTKWNCFEVLKDSAPDIVVRCWRCKEKTNVRLRLQLPKILVQTEPKPVFCSNLHCLHRLGDVSQPVMYLESTKDSDLSFLCSRCKNMTCLQLSGLVRVDRQ